jgi:hypothetical protein
MFRPIYHFIAALTLSALMTVTVVAATEDSQHSTPVVEGHWCC